MFSINIYTKLCSHRKNLKDSYKPFSGLHRHHIIPKHSGGNDEDDNYTYLTIREHIIAHYLLWRIHKNPNDLRSMKMLGSKLSPRFRQITGEYCRDNKIGFFSDDWNTKENILKRNNTTIKTQKDQYEKTGEKNFYFWSTPEGRKERSLLGNKAAMVSQRNDYLNNKTKNFYFWSTPEGRKERASMGAQAHKGKRCMYKPGDASFKRIPPEKIDQYLANGYVFGSPIKAWNSKQ